MGLLSKKRVLLGISGGIAAYKSAELVRLLRAEGADVRVVMTAAACAFVAPLTFQALSGHPVALELLNAEQESAMGHIELARWADCILIAPASADCIARLRAGLADDLLMTLCLAAEVPINLAPAMNQAMWHNPATQENIQCLQQRGVRMLGPASGSQACGELGLGRMLEPVEILRQLGADQPEGILHGVPVLVTAGPTREAIDPVRYISNRSSGKMGYAVAEAAVAAGAQVTLISGPVALPAPAGIERVTVESAEHMYQAVMARIQGQQIFVATAAVADYTPVHSAGHKMKKQPGETVLTLVQTRDILAAVAHLEAAPFTVGFAAETQNLEQYAQAKLVAKSLDMIAANRVGGREGGFDSDRNALQVFWPGGQRALNMAPKTELATQLISIIAERFHAQRTTENTRPASG